MASLQDAAFRTSPWIPNVQKKLADRTLMTSLEQSLSFKHGEKVFEDENDTDFSETRFC